MMRKELDEKNSRNNEWWYFMNFATRRLSLWPNGYIVKIQTLEFRWVGITSLTRRTNLRETTTLEAKSEAWKRYGIGCMMCVHTSRSIIENIILPEGKTQKPGGAMRCFGYCHRCCDTGRAEPSRLTPPPVKRIQIACEESDEWSAQHDCLVFEPKGDSTIASASIANFWSALPPRCVCSMWFQWSHEIEARQTWLKFPIRWTLQKIIPKTSPPCKLSLWLANSAKCHRTPHLWSFQLKSKNRPRKAPARLLYLAGKLHMSHLWKKSWVHTSRWAKAAMTTTMHRRQSTHQSSVEAHGWNIEISHMKR